MNACACLQQMYISLPKAPARSDMFKVHLGDTPHSLTQADFDDLGTRTEGFSGLTIKTITKESMFEPIRKTQEATHFRYIVSLRNIYSLLMNWCSFSFVNTWRCILVSGLNMLSQLHCIFTQDQCQSTSHVPSNSCNAPQWFKSQFRKKYIP